MRKLLTLSLIAASLVPAVASANPSYGELRRDRREIREERRDLNRAYAYGDARDIHDAREDYREARREYREDLRDFGRHDWRGYRNGNRSLYARGTFRSPYAYQSFRPGVRVHSGYYAPRYVIADPWRYRLPRASGYNRWVRHHDDVLLINTRSGYVVDVIRGFYG